MDFELMELRNRSIQYHIAALNGLKNLMEALKTLDNPSDIDNAMITNDELADILNNGESIYQKFVISSNYEKESLELYILFLRNSMGVQAREDTDDRNNKYEKSEKLSSSMNSDPESRKSRIKNGIRFISIAIASGIPYQNITHYEPPVQINIDYLEQEYLKATYPVHSVETSGQTYIQPICNGVVDETRETNYFLVMTKITKYISILYDKKNSKGQLGKITINALDLSNNFIQNIIDNHTNMFYYITIALTIFMIFIITQNYFKEQSNDYADQIIEICENYDVEDESICKKMKRDKSPSIKKAKYFYVGYCFIVAFLLLYPFMTVFLYRTECQSLIALLINMSKVPYYLFSINLFAIEIFVKDRNYYADGEELRFLNERFKTLETLRDDLKDGKYGGKSYVDYEIFSVLHNANKCVRHPFSLGLCDIREFDELYTEELANSNFDYMTIELFSKLKDFINDPPQKRYNLTDQEEVRELYYDILGSPYIQLIRKLSEDIIGHTEQMNQLGISYLENEIDKYKEITIICHATSSIIIFITFYFFVTRPVKKQLRAIDCLTNVTFSIPSSIINSAPKLKNFIENGKLEDS
ncbi:hypothetical protein PIROE2DRAFT_65169 [Piromyces sp. E2]|nr:hypothetical protein PIROE2DRAFT_65169 [Piromyces sp. E2]|eukprot:OUM57145.1 hypothetical protein PIROE2DRAFT_65169 [Piromyces sp. E2]